MVVVQDLFNWFDEVPLSAWSTFFALNGFFFAVLIGLLIAELLRRFHRLNAVVRMEATALGQIKRALMFQEGTKLSDEAIRSDVRAYAASVVSVEWPDMATKQRIRAEEGAMPELLEVLKKIRALERQDALDVIATRLLIDSVIEATSLRAERLHLAAEQLSPALRWAVLFLSLVIIGSFAALNIGDVGIHIVMVVLLGIGMGLLNYGLAELSQPFVGVWSISRDPFLEVARGRE